MPSRRSASAPASPATAAAEMTRACAALDLNGLIGRMASCDEAALTDFHRIMADRLFSMALRMLGDRESAAEALQDCMVRLWQNAARFDPQRGDAFTWAAMILRGVCLDQLRSRQRRQTGQARWEQSAAAAAEGPAQGGLEDLFFRETVSLVRAALTELDPADRHCLESALFHPCSTAECAAALGIATGTLKVRTHRAMQRLRRLLGADPSPSPP